MNKFAFALRENGYANLPIMQGFSTADTGITQRHDMTVLCEFTSSLKLSSERSHMPAVVSSRWLSAWCQGSITSSHEAKGSRSLPSACLVILLFPWEIMQKAKCQVLHQSFVCLLYGFHLGYCFLSETGDKPCTIIPLPGAVVTKYGPSTWEENAGSLGIRSSLSHILRLPKNKIKHSKTKPQSTLTMFTNKWR